METIEALAACKHYLLYWNDAAEVSTDLIEEKMKEINFLKNSASSEDKEDGDSSSGMKHLQSTLAPFVQLFLEIVAGDLEKAKKTVEDVQDTMDSFSLTGIDQNYLPGFEYLYELIKLHFKLAFQSVAEYENINVRDPPPTALDLDAEYSDLGSHSKCVVVLARWMLNSTHHRSSRETGLQIMREIIELDRTNWYWYNLMYNRLRFTRRSFGDSAVPQSKPSKEEMDMVSEALKHVGSDQSKSRLKCNANLCQCLAEILAFQCLKGQYEPVTLDKKYDDVDKMVEHIKASAKDALFSPHCGFAEYIRYGDIFGIIFPYDKRDYMMAIAFIKAANTKYPDNSKGHHKMGAIIVNAKKDMKIAIHHFEEAIRLEPRSFPAWVDLLNALLRDYKENEIKVKEVLENARNKNHQWTPKQLGAFYFYEASMAFLAGSHDKAVKLWREAMKMDYNGFKELGRMRARFSWPREHPLTFHAINRVLDVAYTRDMEVIDEIRKLREIVHEEDRKTSEFYHQKTAREKDTRRNRYSAGSNSRVSWN